MSASGIALLMVASSVSFAQSPTRPQFDVASVKANTTCHGTKEKDPIPHPGALTIPCITLKDLVQLSYVMFANGGARNPENVDIIGGPAWFPSGVPLTTTWTEIRSSCVRYVGFQTRRINAPVTTTATCRVN